LRSQIATEGARPVSLRTGNRVTGPFLPLTASWAVRVLDIFVLVWPEVGEPWVMVPVRRVVRRRRASLG
jgi:hypothetical protein